MHSSYTQTHKHTNTHTHKHTLADTLAVVRPCTGAQGRRSAAEVKSKKKEGCCCSRSEARYEASESRKTSFIGGRHLHDPTSPLGGVAPWAVDALQGIREENGRPRRVGLESLGHEVPRSHGDGHHRDDRHHPRGLYSRVQGKVCRAVRAACWVQCRGHGLASVVHLLCCVRCLPLDGLADLRSLLTKGIGDGWRHVTDCIRHLILGTLGLMFDLPGEFRGVAVPRQRQRQRDLVHIGSAGVGNLLREVFYHVASTIQSLAGLLFVVSGALCDLLPLLSHLLDNRLGISCRR
mmetsp:Transcript_62072/g.131118  ORF Transcript_62072/g.131118 Transcript_62072/m.131118 type:complete len:292 (+) Transcript_62072:99-974(+)